MESDVSTEALVARLDPEIDRISGLITVSASAEKVVALVDSRDSIVPVREELLGLGVPVDVLELTVVGDVLTHIPSPMPGSHSG